MTGVREGGQHSCNFNDDGDCCLYFRPIWPNVNLYLSTIEMSERIDQTAEKAKKDVCMLDAAVGSLLGMTGLLVGLLLLIVLTMRGFNLFILAPLCALLVAVTNGIPFW
ncbi:MAG: hypothetical protein ACK4NN_17540, partial [Rheinheimera sp.]